MKQTFAIISGLLLGVTVFGSSELTLPISTPGPDTYADGTSVLVGETYLLVYVSQDHSFQGILTDGTLVDPVNNRIVTRATAVEGSRCGFKYINYPETLYPSGGSFLIVLLDTRDASGSVDGLVAGLGSSSATAAASAESTSLSSLSTSMQSGSASTLSTTVSSLAPANTPVPVITTVASGDGAANIHVKNLADNVLYKLESTTDLAAGGSWQTASSAGKDLSRITKKPLEMVVGKDGASELPVAVTVPANDKVRFFRVIVHGSN